MNKREEGKKIEQIDIKCFDMNKHLHFTLIIQNDSTLLRRGWGIEKQEDEIKQSELINSISKYTFFFFVEKNHYIVENKGEQGYALKIGDIMLDFVLHRKSGTCIRKEIIIEPNIIYTEEFITFFHLLDSLHEIA